MIMTFVLVIMIELSDHRFLPKDKSSDSNVAPNFKTREPPHKLQKGFLERRRESKMFRINLPFMMNGRPDKIRIGRKSKNVRRKITDTGFFSWNGLPTRLRIFTPPYTELL